MRCRHCGARNPDGADWCSQCLRPLREGGPPDRPEPDGTEEPEVPATTAPASSDPDVLEAGGGRFRRGDQGLEWTCARCDTWNSLEQLHCTVCGAPFGVSEAEPSRRRDVDPAAVLGWTIVAPGIGHVLMGRPGTGFARLTTWLLWAVGGVAFLAAGGLTVGSLLPGLVLLLGAGVVWAATIIDVRTLLADGRHELLDTRRLLWLVVGVIVALTFAFLVTALTVRA